jgi:hypothetical protein
MLVTKRAIQAASAQTGRCGEVIQRCARISIRPELIARRRNDVCFIEPPGPCHH